MWAEEIDTPMYLLFLAITFTYDIHYALWTQNSSGYARHGNSQDPEQAEVDKPLTTNAWDTDSPRSHTIICTRTCCNSEKKATVIQEAQKLQNLLHLSLSKHNTSCSSSLLILKMMTWKGKHRATYTLFLSVFPHSAVSWGRQFK